MKRITCYVVFFFIVKNIVVFTDSSKEIEKLLANSSNARYSAPRYRRLIDNKTEISTDHDESRLINYLFRSHNSEIRPVKNVSEAIQLVFGLAYAQLVDLDEKNQILTSSLWIRMFWHNHLLKWDKGDYGGIETVNVNPHNLWLPDIVLYDNAQERLGSGQLDQLKTKVILDSSGFTTWYAPAILKSRCNIDVRYFPFDEQKCELTFLSWVYNGYQLNITSQKSEADRTSYLESGEFELLSAKASQRVRYFNCCTEPYPQVTFTLRMRRKPLYYINNFIVPCFLLTNLGFLAFVVTPRLGERVTIIITALIAITIFMLIISDSTPSSPNATPLIGKFLFISLVMMCLSLIVTCIALNIYKSTIPIEHIPKRIRSVLLDYLMPILRITPPSNISFKKYISSSAAKNDDGSTTVSTDHHNTIRHLHKSDNAVDKLFVTRHCGVETLSNRISQQFSLLAKRARVERKLQEISAEWEVLSKVADRVFLIIFTLMLLALSVHMYVSRPEKLTFENKYSLDGI